MKYRKAYKCRLCGKEFYASDNDLLNLKELRLHFCDDEGIGFADLLGVRNVEE